MKTLIAIFTTSCALLFWALPARTADFRLEEGTPIRLRLKHTISSADVLLNDRVYFEALDETKLSGIVVIPRGSLAVATVTDAEHKKRLGRGGRLSINIDFVRLQDGEKCVLSARRETKSGNHYGREVGEMVATAIFFPAAAPLFLFQHGKDMKIPEGTIITAYVSTDMILKAENFGPNAVKSDAWAEDDSSPKQFKVEAKKDKQPAAHTSKNDLENEEARFKSNWNTH